MERKEFAEYYDDVPLTDCARCGREVGNPDWEDEVLCPACDRGSESPREVIEGPWSRGMNDLLARLDARCAAREAA